MAKIYYEAVKAGKRTLESVPTRWRAKVKEMLDADKAAETAEDGE